MYNNIEHNNIIYNQVPAVYKKASSTDFFFLFLLDIYVIIICLLSIFFLYLLIYFPTMLAYLSVYRLQRSINWMFIELIRYCYYVIMSTIKCIQLNVLISVLSLYLTSCITYSDYSYQSTTICIYLSTRFEFVVRSLLYNI